MNARPVDSHTIMLFQGFIDAVEVSDVLSLLIQ
jgi:hypothetical protein